MESNKQQDDQDNLLGDTWPSSHPVFTGHIWLLKSLSTYKASPKVRRTLFQNLAVRSEITLQPTRGRTCIQVGRVHWKHYCCPCCYCWARYHDAPHQHWSDLRPAGESLSLIFLSKQASESDAASLSLTNLLGQRHTFAVSLQRFRMSASCRLSISR